MGLNRRAKGPTWVAGLISLVALVTAMPTRAQDTEPVPAASDDQSVLTIKRNATESELRDVAKSIADSKARADALEKSIAGIDKTLAGIRTALVDSAARRKELDGKILDTEKRLTALSGQEGKVKASLHSRRGLLAEVLAALERMGRNPPPALLVKPEDALSSVRSAILLGAVVPGIRTETDKLASDLKSLADLQKQITADKEDYVHTMTASIEEERRMGILAEENDRLGQRSRDELENEKSRSAALAARATSLESLITSIEGEISSARVAAETAKAEDDRRAGLSPEEREQARKDAESGLPDKNRIAPAYAFSDLTAKLDLPVAGDILRFYGDDDGTGHQAQGMTIAAAADNVVTAPADGWIMFAGPFRSYGQMVIMNTGDGFHMILSGMDKVTARQGQFAVAGEPIGRMGTKRIASAADVNLETDRPTLYIEFRKDGKPVDSRPWWNAKELGKARNDT